MTMYKALKHSYSVLLGVVLLLTGCDIPVQKFEDLDGVIIGWGARSGTVVYIPSTGESWEVKWSKGMLNETFACRSQADTLLMYADSWSETKSTDLLRFVYKYDPVTGNYNKSDSLSEPISYCNSLDFDETQKTYLMVGTYSVDEGIFMLDSNFSLKENITLQYPCLTIRDRGSYYESATRLSDGNIIYRCNFQTIISGNSTMVISNPDSVDVLAISSDRNKVLYSTGTDKAMKLFVHNVEQNSTKQLQIDSKIVHNASFSPDQKYIVFCESTYNFSNAVKLNIYDLATDTFTFTGLYVDGNLYWGNFSGNISKTVQLVQ